MEIDPFPANLSDIEYSVITSVVIKGLTVLNLRQTM